MHACAADLAARSKELADAAAERNKARSEAAAAGRAADKLTAQMAALPKALSCHLTHDPLNNAKLRLVLLT